MNKDFDSGIVLFFTSYLGINMKKILLLSLCALHSLFAISERKVDVAIIGSGVGGLTSAIYLARGGIKPLVLEGDNPGGAITQSRGVQNWPGEIEISGFDLTDKIRNQAQECGATFARQEVVDFDFSSQPFVITTQDVADPSHKEKIFAKACIIATGTKVRTLGLASEKTYESKGVYTCAICDGALYKDKVVAVVGGGDAAVLEAEYLSSIAKKVYVLVRGPQLKGVEKIRRENLKTKSNVQILYQTTVQEILGSEEHVTSLDILSNGKKENLVLDALFLAIGSVPNTELVKGKLELDSSGYIVSKQGFATSVPGVFAVGDVIDPVFKQAISASGDGAKAAMQAQMYLSSVEVKQEARVIEVQTLAELKKLTKESKVPVLVDFYASWCGPCRQLSPVMDSWAKKLQGKAIICKINVDKAQDIARMYNIQSMPTVLHISAEGKEMKRTVGSTQIIQYMDSLYK